MVLGYTESMLVGGAVMSDFDRPVSVQAEEAEDQGCNPSGNATLGDVIAQRLSRRDVVRGALAVSVAAAALSPMLEAREAAAAPADAAAGGVFDFAELGVVDDETHHVADGYDADVLIRWGDPVLADAPEFAPATQGPEAQAKQFGYNNDFIGFIPDGASLQRARAAGRQSRVYQRRIDVAGPAAARAAHGRRCRNERNFRGDHRAACGESR